MTLGTYISGWAILAIALACLLLAAVRVRARIASSLRGPHARLAEAIIALSVLEVVLQVLGVIGVLQRSAVIVAVPVVALGVAALAGRFPRRPQSIPGEAAPGRTEPDRLLRLAAVVLLVVVATQWLGHASKGLNGFEDFDSLRYHGPNAINWIQAGSILDLQHTSAEAQEAFFPGNVELLDAYGILVLGQDTLLPLRNMVWLALAFLAIWCAGRRVGNPWIAVAGLAALCSTPLLVDIGPSTAKTDLCAVALLLAAVAFLLHALPPTEAATDGGDVPAGRTDLGLWALAGLAAGLAAGTKLTILMPLGVLGIGVAAMSGRRTFWRAIAAYGGPMFLTGGIWYVRNLVLTGTPLPWFRLGIGRFMLPSPPMLMSEEYGFTVMHYATDAGFWSDTVPDGLMQSFGPLWPVWLLGTAAAAVAAIVSPPRDRGRRLVGIAALVSMIAYTVTPFSAGGPEGNPRLFALDLRFLAPALSLAFVTMAGLRRGRIPMAVAAAMIFAHQFIDPPTEIDVALVVAATAAAGIGLVVWHLTRNGIVRPSPGGRSLALPVVAVVLLAVTAVSGWHVQQHQEQTRYAAANTGRGDAFRLFRTIRDSRVAVGSFAHTYPLYGPDLSNRVEYVGLSLPHGGFRQAASCVEWRTALRDGGYDYVVLSRSPVAPQTKPEEVVWTADDPAAEILMRRGATWVFRLDGAPDPATCPPG